MSEVYQWWKRTKDKGDPSFWQSTEFPREYTQFELNKKKKMVRYLIKNEMRAAILSTGKTSLEVLSLGCGPGSDLLAAMAVIQSVFKEMDPRYWSQAGSPSVRYTGVDLHDWPLEAFWARSSLIAAQGPVGFEYEGFYLQCSMQRYANHILMATRKSFDFVILSFAEVKNNIDFVATLLPRLLRDEHSRIFVIDNNIGPVRQLKKLGFRQIGLCSGKTVCLMLTARARTLALY